ncbi:hypothetical protein M758_UG143500 [Ceratodon purpureus]|nr:hypothetical protein M758_UG143500 [Ceratodon purpureus]
MEGFSPESSFGYGYSERDDVGNNVTVWKWDDLYDILSDIEIEDSGVVMEFVHGSSVLHVEDQANFGNLTSGRGGSCPVCFNSAGQSVDDTVRDPCDLRLVDYLPCSKWFTSHLEDCVDAHDLSATRTSRRKIFRSRPNIVCPYGDLKGLNDMPGLEGNYDQAYEVLVDDMPALDSCLELQTVTGDVAEYAFSPERRCHFLFLLLHVLVLQSIFEVEELPYLVSDDLIQLICLFGVEEHLRQCLSRSCLLHLMSWTLVC